MYLDYFYANRYVYFSFDESWWTKYWLLDIDECNTSHECDSNATCTDSTGSYSCECNYGFTGDGYDGNCAGMECILKVGFEHNFDFHFSANLMLMGEFKYQSNSFLFLMKTL